MRKDIKDLLSKLRKQRKVKGIKLVDVAHKMGCMPSYIKSLEDGEHNPSLETLYKYSDALGISLGSIFALEVPNIDMRTPSKAKCFSIGRYKVPAKKFLNLNNRSKSLLTLLLNYDMEKIFQIKYSTLTKALNCNERVLLRNLKELRESGMIASSTLYGSNGIILINILL